MSKPPFRNACGPDKTYRGCCFDHSPDPVLVDKYVNVTVVANWDTDIGGTIPPYERFVPSTGGDASCESHSCRDADGVKAYGDCSGPEAPSVPWLQPYTANTFHHTDGEQVNFAVSRKKAFKNAEAARSWHGTFGWTSTDAGCDDLLCGDGSTRRSYQGAPDQTKYLVVTYDVHMRNHFDAGEDAGGYLNADKTGSRTVIAATGEVTSSLLTAEVGAQNYGGGTGVQIDHSISGGAGYRADMGITYQTFDHGGGTVLDSKDNDLHCGFPHFRGDADFDLPGFIAVWNAVHVTPMPVMADLNSYTCSIASSDSDGDWTVDATFSRSNTVASWHFTVTQDNGADEVNTWEYYGTVTLSSAWTFADILGDAEDNLVSLYPLNDDSFYPWRTDNKVSIAPRVTRNEMDNVNPIGFNTYTVDDLTAPVNDADGNPPFNASPAWTPTYTQMPWFDPANYEWTFAPGTDATNAAATGRRTLFDGSIVGAPLPAGYQDYFAFSFQDIRGCCNRPGDGSQFWTWYPFGSGMNVSKFNALAGCQLPLNATQWNNFPQAINKPAGAFIFYADHADYFGPGCLSSNAGTVPSRAFDSGKLVVRKWAETLQQWPSQNFALPAGDMKFWYDELKVFCVTNASGAGEGSTWNVIDPMTGLAPIDATDFSGVWGGSSVAGFYAVASYAAGVLTLGAKSYDVPSNWASKSNGDDALCFGKLRYPSSASLLGRLAITPDGTGTIMTFASAQPAFGMDSAIHQEQVDLYDETFALLVSNVTATRTSDTAFTIAAGQPAAKWVQIHGAAKWYMNDTGPKGDYLVLQWIADFRAFGPPGYPGEYTRLEGILDCDGVQMTRPATITYADADCHGHDATVDSPGHGYAKFCQTEGCLPFTPCVPKVVCISPNGETWANGTTYPFPETYLADETYGSKWWGYVQSTMTELFWQAPHRPCNIESCAEWKMDDGTCTPDDPLSCPEVCCPEDPDWDGTGTPPKYYFPLAPQVEARLTVPDNYGLGQDESAPALPADVQIGWLSPVEHDYTDGDVALPPAPPGVDVSTGAPLDAATAWTLHDLLCAHGPGTGCRFTYELPLC